MIHHVFNKLGHLKDGLLANLENKIGTANLMKLFLSNDNFWLIPKVLESVTKETRQNILDFFDALTSEEIDGYLQEGSFQSLCYVLVNIPELALLPPYKENHPYEKTFLLKQLITGSDFQSLSKGLHALNKWSNQPFKKFLVELVGKHIHKIGAGTPDGTVCDNSEKIQYLSLLNRFEKLDAGVLEAVCGTIDIECLLQEEYCERLLRSLFFLLSIYDVDTQMRIDVLDLSNSEKMKDVLSNATVLDIFLYLWNTYILYDVEKAGGFRDWLNPGILNAILGRIKKERDPGSRKDNYNHLVMLMGFMLYLDIEKKRVRKLFPQKYRPTFDSFQIALEVESNTFLPGFFFLKGHEFFREQSFSASEWKRLAPKLEDYQAKKPSALVKVIREFETLVKKR